MENSQTKGQIHCVFGPQGSGKSTYSQTLVKRHKAIYFSIDQWMKELCLSDISDPMEIEFSWVIERVKRCESLIWATTKLIANNGTDVVLDLGFTKLSSRKKFKALSEEASLEKQFYYLTAPYKTRKERVTNRNQEKGTTFTFEVTPMMFDFMENEFEEATDEELLTTNIIK